ncbi:MAG TPA: 4a-hydroxytetrahydrobiopterin dehydratase [Gemmatales bacterium]|nr:4a-hydroxytetrahydrobiopterin dehydratase [Gemmatales bacterium]
MSTSIACELTGKKCLPCEGGVPVLPREEVDRLLAGLPGWSLIADGKAIQRSWRCKDFLTALKFFQNVAVIAEAEDHHPDLHLTGYRNVTIQMTTHAIDGLSENDFILAAKIDQVPIELKK